MYEGHTPEMKTFLEKTFKNNDLVWIRRLGDEAKAEFSAVVKGIYAQAPFEHYIVELTPEAKEQVKKANVEFETWTWDCVVMPKACLDKRDP